MSEILIGEALEKSYGNGPQKTDVLKGVTVSIDKGESICIVGPSGAGKSTLLHLLGTIDRPTAGRVLFQGEDLSHYSEEALSQLRNRKIGFVFQFHHLLPEFSALENVILPLLLRSMTKNQQEEMAREALSLVGLRGKEDSLPGELSGGEQQRVAVARALVVEPEVILADEPTGNLDGETGNRLMELLFELNSQREMTLVYVSHSEVLAQKAGTVFTLEDGHLA